ncbi:phosphatase PAP2 family protein [Herbaspirillum sp. GCM10030257]|uniref:phosphatase PAP2 family protein n=1 Tax=Herbaspirillum sp. GCM10030257 TaxID=3273393 RepID=UPI00360B2E32
MIEWSEITRFGDVTITCFAALAIAAWLLAENENRLALCWSLLFATGMAVVVATKMAFIGWGIGIRAIDFTGFSGHAMRSTAVMPVLFYLMLEKAPRSVRGIGALFGLIFGIVVGISRLAVHAHSVSEVIAGWMLGAAVSVSFIWVAGSTLRNQVFNPLRVMVSMLALLTAPYVHPAPTQQWLTKITLFVSGHDKAFPRRDWQHLRPRIEFGRPLPASTTLPAPTPSSAATSL